MTQPFDNENFDEEDNVFDDNPTEPGSNNSKNSTKLKFMKFWKDVKDKTSETTSKTINYSKERLSIEGQLKQARISLERYINPQIFKKKIKDTKIPKWVLKKAHGIVFLSIIKMGFLFAGNAGFGVVMAKTKSGWSSVSSIGVGGLSAGLLVGVSKTDVIMILPDDETVKQFSGKGQFRFGGNFQLAAGPIGRDSSGSIGIGDKGVSIIFSYSHSVGLYGGVGLDGAIIHVRPDCNERFYKKKVKVENILNGQEEMPPNNDYDMIVRLLNTYANVNNDDKNNNNNNNDNKKKA